MKKLLGLLLILSFPLALGHSHKKHLFEKSLQVNGKNLTLNGVGKRLATIFSLKVYLGALYLEKKSKDANEILKSNQAKYVIMHFQRELSKKKLEGGFKKGLKANKVDQKKYAKEIKQLFSVIEESKPGERITLYMDNKMVEVAKGKRRLQIPSATFGNQLLKLFIGTPPNKALKKGMLGK